MKTKRFLLATSGATVDGREIDAAMLEQMASSYDPNTYAARLNIEHIRGISSDGAFRAYGDVLSLETEKVTVNFNGEDEERTGLYGTFDVTDDAKRLNKAGQKLYSSIEINPDFGKKGYAYLMGGALTDSPASNATARLEFNRSLPGTITLSADKAAQAAMLEFAGEGDAAEGGDGFLGKLSGILDGFAAKFSAPAAPAAAAAAAGTEAGGEGDDAAALDFGQLRPLFEDLGKQFAASTAALQQEFRDAQDDLAVKVKAIETQLEGSTSQQHTQRPAAAGRNGKFAKTDC